MNQFKHDIEAIMSHQTDNGFDLWTTPDLKLLKGAPFTTLESPLYLLELGLPLSDPLFAKVADLIFSTWRKDGRFKISPAGAIYPCHVALALKTLCYLGHSSDERLQHSLAFLINIQEVDGGWKCHKYSFGRGEETTYSTPNTTLIILDCLRFFEFPEKEAVTRKAIEFLLHHWEIKRPISPCHYGIGTLFMQTEYPFRGYNLFYYVYVLSFYQTALQDQRFTDAYQRLAEKSVDGKLIVERVVPKLGKLSFCKKGEPSQLATQKFNDINDNLMRSDRANHKNLD
ncbi:prenyltransferase [Vagococcus sp. BWB3-3]|uniref:Prenyltransferase n=2 Tax=Vagococcus allomyrinae TaxID=2794353 RepID=A0A940STI9_9ENTE|nr:prenyltransferase [Vagococcus allomyrinae]MBP1040335.1 prenyltransferase [Vagococcus allomyrinae]